jgi:hypothetical protein
MFTYLNEKTASIELREAEYPWGTWSSPHLVASATQYPQLYGAFLTPSFQRNLLGRGQLAVFRRCSLGPYQSRDGRFTASPARTALKSGQLTCGDITIICETVH